MTVGEFVGFLLVLVLAFIIVGLEWSVFGRNKDVENCPKCKSINLEHFGDESNGNYMFSRCGKCGFMFEEEKD